MDDLNKTKLKFKKSTKDKSIPSNEWLPFFIIKSPDNKSKVFEIQTNKEVKLGRTEESDIYIDDELASRNHATITWEETKLKLNDLGSTNGTVVNGQKIKEHYLKDGDEVIIGSTILQFFIPMSIGDRIAGTTIRTHNYFEMRLKEELDRAARYNRPLSLLMMCPDIPDSKLSESDKIISELVLTINTMIRTMDLLALYGKNELELMLPETSKQEAFKLAEKMTKEIFGRTKISISIGIANYPEDTLSQELLIDSSRKAMKLSRGNKDQKITDISVNVKTITLSSHPIIIQSEKMKQIFEMVSRIASSNISVLILGETGVGKEVVTEAIHYQSPRKTNTLVSVNCAALTETLLESELFGHEKGSFTGADRTKIGLFETAKGGTIFLDEIGEMPAKTQAKLLRVLQTHKLMRVGSSSVIEVDVRVIAASNKNLEESIKTGMFREDLFYRLNAITITVPPLRERKEEITPLVESFIEQFNKENGKSIQKISPDTMDLLISYDWPGNIRELKNTIERAVVIADGDTIFKENLPSKIFKSPLTREPFGASEAEAESDVVSNEKETFVGNMKEMVDSYEMKVIVSALKKSNWNQTKAADLLKVPRRTLVSKIKKYDIKRER